MRIPTGSKEEGADAVRGFDPSCPLILAVLWNEETFLPEGRDFHVFHQDMDPDR